MRVLFLDNAGNTISFYDAIQLPENFKVGHGICLVLEDGKEYHGKITNITWVVQYNRFSAVKVYCQRNDESVCGYGVDG